ncbi:hypothetical protein [Leifsonia sp. TF02-11]|uniref:hypothetical protein n=1 Tax=Leifsonia sp. TF02-11 TaxID=2815212 RepID=UPI001AA17431|nr:hypothetical protein [Leifsonia sp. TF02-11]MBO1737148.1 hypothetical protein [Leifsonia sp. TF02-11]
MRRTSVSAAALAAVVALILAGCAAPAHEATPSAATPPPTPTPTSSAAAAPTLRVPATCDQLASASVLADGFRTKVVAQKVTPPRSPAAYADERVGALSCRWESPERWPGTTQAAINAWLTVVPGATSAAVEHEKTGGWGPGTPLDNATEGFQFCAREQFQLCGFVARVGGYGISGGVWDYGDATYESQSAALHALVSSSIPSVAGLPSPVALWQPTSATLRGASDCDGLLTPDQISAATGREDAYEVKADGGENALSTLEANGLVGSYYCAFSVGTDQGVRASVLPGGASYALATRPADAVDVAGLGTSAYRTSDEIDVIADSGWVQVSASPGSADGAALIALAKQVLANVSG